MTSAVVNKVGTDVVTLEMIQTSSDETTVSLREALLDGSKDEDFIHIAGIVQFGSFSWINMLPETIVVGIANVDRKRDFTYPSQNTLDQEEFPTSGKSAHFIQF